MKFFSENPGKRAAERCYLIYTPIWGTLAGLVMVAGLGVHWSRQPWGDLAFPSSHTAFQDWMKAAK